MYELFIALFAAVALVFMLGLFMAYLTRNGNFKFEQIGAFLVLAVVGLAIFGYANWSEKNNWEYWQTQGNNLAKFEKHENALTNYEKAMHFAVKEFGPRDLRVANSKLALANLYEQYGRYDEAREEYVEAISILEENADSDSPVLQDAYARLKELDS